MDKTTEKMAATLKELAALRVKTGTADRRRIEDQAWDDLIALDAEKMDARFTAQSRKLDDDLDAEATHMDDRHEIRKRGLERIQTLENDAADTGLAGKKA